MWIFINSIISILFASYLFLAEPALAQGTGLQGSPSEPTRIEADSEHGEIRFYVDGVLTAVLKEDGLHVRESVGFGGTMTDYGQSGFDDLSRSPNTPKNQNKGSADAR